MWYYCSQAANGLNPKYNQTERYRDVGCAKEPGNASRKQFWRNSPKRIANTAGTFMINARKE